MRGPKLWIGLAATVLVAAAVVATFAIVNGHRSDVAAADEVAVVYNAGLAAYETQSAARIDQQAKVAIEKNDYASLSVLIADIRTNIPKPVAARLSDYGASHSARFEMATKRSARFQRRLGDVGSYVDREATVVAAFVDAGRRPFAKPPQDLLPQEPLADGKPVRTELAAPYEAWLEEFEQTTVPQGQEDLAVQTTKTLEDFLADVDRLARSLDQHKSFSFNPSKGFNAVIARFEALDQATEKEVAARVKRLTKSR